MLYAHGFVGAEDEIALPPEGDLLIGLLVPQGFAVAFTSFSENGWAVKDGADRTHQLLAIFTSKFGQPSRVYVGGASMGGLITIKLIEDYPGAFAGALPSRTVAGGARRQFDYVGNTRALFDFFYPGVLPGTAGEVPPGLDITQAIVLPAVAAMQRDPAAAFTIGSINQTRFHLRRHQSSCSQLPRLSPGMRCRLAISSTAPTATPISTIMIRSTQGACPPRPLENQCRCRAFQRDAQRG